MFLLDSTNFLKALTLPSWELLSTTIISKDIPLVLLITELTASTVNFSVLNETIMTDMSFILYMCVFYKCVYIFLNSMYSKYVSPNVAAPTTRRIHVELLTNLTITF